MIKHHDPEQSVKERVCHSRGRVPDGRGGVATGGRNRKLRGHIPNPLQRENTGSGQGHKVSRPTPRGVLPQTVLLAGNCVLNTLTLEDVSHLNHKWLGIAMHSLIRSTLKVGWLILSLLGTSCSHQRGEKPN